MLNLKDRGVVQITGPDSQSFLNGIVTADILNAKQDDMIYALFLKSNSKILYDAFIFKKSEEQFLIDCPRSYISNLIKMLTVYKLRMNLSIIERNDLEVYITDQNLDQFYKDCRRLNFIYYRGIKEPKAQDENKNLELYTQYHIARIKALIPDYTIDLDKELYFPHDLDMDSLGAISYTKGCYIGQEVVARTHYRNIRRKGLIRIQLHHSLAIPVKNTPIIDPNTGFISGFVLGIIEGGFGLALLNLDSELYDEDGTLILTKEYINEQYI